MLDAAVVVVPGLGGSSPGHWQSIWQAEHPSWVRSAPTSWDQPVFDDWDRAVGAAAATAGEPAFLVAHSLGCLTALAFAARSPDLVRGVFLVAPPDPDAPSFPSEVLRFATVTAALGPVPTPTVAVTSTTDPYCAAHRAPEICRRWGARRIDIGDAGHINVLSGHGPWPEGREMLRAFVHEVTEQR